jgi:hypothetical protein
MKILFLNGSPQGSNSITLQTALYLEKRYPSHTYACLPVGQQIRQLEKVPAEEPGRSRSPMTSGGVFDAEKRL